MELLTISIAILALLVSVSTWWGNTYRVKINPYWNFEDNRNNYPDKACLTIEIVNAGGQVAYIHAIGVTTAGRESTNMLSTGSQRKSILLKQFESPLLVPPRSRKKYKSLLDDPETILELDNSDAFIWVEDGAYNKYERTVVNGYRNKKMHWTKKSGGFPFFRC